MARFSQLTALDPKTSPKGVFARHETFHPRFGWLKKGFDRALANPHIFLEEDAPVQLGVGKNMVKSIRYWCHGFKILAEDRPTQFGRQLLGKRGWDPYLEDPASLWLLHWKLLEDPCTATAWQIIFNQMNQPVFTEEDLLDCLKRSRGNLADSSFKKDISCLLRMYGRQPMGKKGVASEDSLDCPFVELGLIQPMGGSRTKGSYRFPREAKPSLVPEVILYGALHYAARLGETARTIPLARLLYNAGSPGQGFKLTESSLCGAIETLGKRYRELSLEDAAGKLQLRFDVSDPVDFGTKLLDQYYQNR